MKDVSHEAEERLLIEAAKTDRARFAELYELHFERVYAFIGRRVYDRATVQDLTSEVFRRALENLDRFEWRGVPFAAWLFRIASNAISNHRQRAAKEIGTVEQEERAAPSTPGVTTIENRAALYRLVRELSPEHRRVIELRFADEKSIREIAEELGRTEGAVKQLQFRAIQNLRERMGGKNG
ncbi:MAG TPA: sigma-70 family RNA polymerase sigma factor [Terriglobales bacterium]|nr:sigma-70 family RNA polymerase sigma factor [Terriglobales bacterium]